MDVIQTQIGIYIIKVTDKEQAHTKTLAEGVMPLLQGALAKQKADARWPIDLAQKIGDQLRQDRESLRLMPSPGNLI